MGFVGALVKFSSPLTSTDLRAGSELCLHQGLGTSLLVRILSFLYILPSSCQLLKLWEISLLYDTAISLLGFCAL